MAKERLIITQGLCDKVGKLTAHGMEQKEIAELLGISLATIGRIKAAGYDAGFYKMMNKKRCEDDYMKKMERKWKKEGGNPPPALSQLTQAKLMNGDITAQRQKALLDKFIEEKQAEDQEEKRTGQLQGQITMNLQELEGKPQAEEQKKLYRFLAGQFDEVEIAICDKLGKIYDMLNQILRAIRKE